MTEEKLPCHRSAIERAGEDWNALPDLVVSKGQCERTKSHQCTRQRLAAATGGYECGNGEPLQRQQRREEKYAIEEGARRTVMQGLRGAGAGQSRLWKAVMFPQVFSHNAGDIRIVRLAI